MSFKLVSFFTYIYKKSMTRFLALWLNILLSFLCNVDVIYVGLLYIQL